MMIREKFLKNLRKIKTPYNSTYAPPIKQKRQKLIFVKRLILFAKRYVQ